MEKLPSHSNAIKQTPRSVPINVLSAPNPSTVSSIPIDTSAPIQAKRHTHASSPAARNGSQGATSSRDTHAFTLDPRASESQ
ncbi:hypothetical protein BGW39_011001 [Mortierella sp. 14UC]|nr:hypothetical protein BGW39_011001 [Mortierella sp. 14UC]